MDPFPRRAPDFMLPDPQSWNSYAYARNNPLAYTDPSGESPNPLDVADGGFAAKSYGEFLWSGVKSVGAALKGDWAAVEKYQQEGAIAATEALTDIGFAVVPGVVNTKGLSLVDDVVGSVKSKVDEVMNSGTVENMQNWVKNIGKNDPQAKPPGTEWRGTGEVGSTAGNYYDETLETSMNPDLNHGPPKGPHWGYQGPDGKFDISPSGDLANKKN